MTRCCGWTARLLTLMMLALVPGLDPVGAQEAAPADPITWPGMTPTGAMLLPNGWSLRPAGRQVELGDFPIRIAECPTAPVLAVLHAGYGEHEVRTLDAGTGARIGSVVVKQTFGGLVWSRDGKALFVGGGANDVIYRYDHADGLLSNRSELAYPAGGPTRLVADLALSADGATLFATNAFGHSIGRFDVKSGKLEGEIATGDGSYPYGLALDEANERLYASLWAKAEVAVIDLKTGRILARWATQEHPNEMLLARSGKILFVANANRNTVSVLDTATGKALETIGTAIAPTAPAGCTPNALALTPDEKVLFVANANTNDVAAVNVTEPGESKPLGLIPVGWYPTSVRVARDGKTLFVANGKGGGSRANRYGPTPSVAASRLGATTREYIAGLFRGTLSRIEMPGPAQMGAYTRTVYECSPLDPADPTAAATAGRPADSPIPAEVGGASPIKYCLYIIKENRTYDQVLGDMPEGNGEPSLCLFPEEVTPNHHALAREFVLLDNFYVESEVSADGHEWTMGAYATDYVERTWPLSYRGDNRIPFPAEGNVLELATPAGGYLWDRAAAKGVSYFSFGEFVENPSGDKPASTNVEALKGHFDPWFMGYNLSVTDQVRADRFLEVLAGWEEKGEMPQLITLRLPNDHTSGTRVGAPTPTAMVADNDLALGRVVEALSKSRFWPEVAIFVVEDDAQNGPDHVDAHRTVALCVSPYSRGQGKDSTLYSTSSMLRTMELILGLDPMSQFDAAARPMYGSFHAKPDTAPYACRPARVDLNAVNTAAAWGADISAGLNLAQEDQADDLLFNEVIWRSVKGADSPMPAPVRAAFVRPRLEDDEEEDEG